LENIQATSLNNS